MKKDKKHILYSNFLLSKCDLKLIKCKEFSKEVKSAGSVYS
ncbi:hypothetical protein RC62_3146 [Flavobacterium aquidurense]|uniref:Uncharacterized protein n=1 Tax=Flavobacterium aquidurense TaxID=362413 RepID=A0A0Q0Y2K2_9FLAO|nr:hypothetical protein RC62_3146 [Flavobacterium aquidurense]